MKLLIECKRKKCVPPFVWEGKYKDDKRAKALVCMWCKSLKVREMK